MPVERARSSAVLLLVRKARSSTWPGDTGRMVYSLARSGYILRQRAGKLLDAAKLSGRRFIISIVSPPAEKTTP